MQIASLGKARRQGGSSITFVQPKFCIDGVEYRYPISGIGTQFQHWNLGYRYPYVFTRYRYQGRGIGTQAPHWDLSIGTGSRVPIPAA
ncbi:hypothetical protein GQ457_08G026880 [Hibiscus cannabinus]